MKLQEFLQTLVPLLYQYFPEEMDPSLKPIDSAESLRHRKITYDFIIVGAGSAGCVLANRLSENQNWKILLIEAGGDENYFTDIPAFFSLPFNSQYDWNYTSTEQKNACRSTQGICQYPRGKLMGGSSSINGMIYDRPSKVILDEWESMGNTGWGYNNVFKYFLKSENMTIPELADSPYHSTKGPLSVGYSVSIPEITNDIVLAAEEYGFTIDDVNGNVRSNRFNFAQKTVRGPTRCSASKAYLNPIRNRTNLVIFKNTEVIRILFNNGTTKRAIGVRCVTNGTQYNVYASKEVILSAGSINSPKLLMLSGVGPRDHLQEMKIPIIANILAVGANLADQPLFSLLYYVNESSTASGDPYTYETGLEFANYKRGPLTTNGIDAVGSLKCPSSNDLPCEIVMGAITGKLPTMQADDTSSMLTIALSFVHPKSTGSVRLASSEYNVAPLIDPNYLAEPSDIEALLWTAKEMFKYMNTSAMSKYSPRWIHESVPECNNFTVGSDDHLNCQINHITSTAYHPVGTCRMGPGTDRNTVVDPNLRVYDIIGLRVVDASVMPRITDCATNVPTITIAEKAADLIKCSHLHQNCN